PGLRHPAAPHRPGRDVPDHDADLRAAAGGAVHRPVHGAVGGGVGVAGAAVPGAEVSRACRLTTARAVRILNRLRTPPSPFSALAGRGPLTPALLLGVIPPGRGGVLVRGTKGLAKSTAVRALAGLLPPVETVAGCPFQRRPGEAVACWP